MRQMYRDVMKPDKDKGDICPNSERAEILNKSLLHPLMFGFLMEEAAELTVCLIISTPVFGVKVGISPEL